MDPLNIEIRDMVATDAHRIWEIRNDEQVRGLSNSNHSIPFQEHVTWFTNYLERDNKVAQVLTENDRVIGYCRIDAALVSIAIDPSAHGKGYGKKLLNSAVSEALRRWPIVTAEVLASNSASQRLFTTNGFTLVRETGESMVYQIHR